MLNRIKGVKYKIAFYNKCFCLSQGQSQFVFLLLYDGFCDFVKNCKL